MKETPSNCDLDQCAYNTMPPSENCQECIGCPYLTNENWQPTTQTPPNTSTTPIPQHLKIYEVTHTQTGDKSYQAATNAQDACKQAGWFTGHCFIIEQQPHRKPLPHHEPLLLVKIPCFTCPFQYAECRKPESEKCPTQPSTPELHDWLKQAAQSRLCHYVGQDLTKNDYNLGQKWLKIEDAINELTPKHSPPTDNLS